MRIETSQKKVEELLDLASRYADASQRATLPVAAKVLKQMAENYLVQANALDSELGARH